MNNTVEITCEMCGYRTSTPANTCRWKCPQCGYYRD